MKDNKEFDTIRIKPGSRKAKVYGVTTSVGGAGSSILSLNIAKEKFRADTNIKAILIDLQFRGSLDNLLSIKSKKGMRWSDILKSCLTPREIYNTLPQLHQNIKVVTSNLRGFYFPTVNEIVQVIKYLAQEVDIIILDIPWVFCFNPQINALIKSFYILTPRSQNGVTNTQNFITEQKQLFFKESKVVTIPHTSKYSLLSSIKTLSISSTEEILGKAICCEMKPSKKVALNVEFGKAPDASFISKDVVHKLFDGSSFIKRFSKKG